MLHRLDDFHVACAAADVAAKAARISASVGRGLRTQQAAEAVMNPGVAVARIAKPSFLVEAALHGRQGAALPE